MIVKLLGRMRIVPALSCALVFALACGNGEESTPDETGSPRASDDQAAAAPTTGSPTAGSFVSVDLCKGVLLTVTADGISETALEESIETLGPFNGPPSWSPDGRRFAIAEGSGNHGLWVMNADGTEAVDLVNDDTGGAHWSPDGSRIAFTRLAGDSFAETIYVVNVDGGGDRKVADGRFVVWSPDGAAIIYSANQRVFAVPADGSGEARELFGVPGTAFGFRVSPDITRVAWIADVGSVTPEPGDPGGSVYALFVATTEGDRGQAELFRPEPPGGLGTQTLSFSPNGHRLAFVELNSDDGSQYIEVVNVDGTGRRRITGDLGYSTSVGDFPLWSPDGSQIVISGDALFLIPVDGSGEKKLEVPPGLGCPSELSVRAAPEG